MKRLAVYFAVMVGCLFVGLTTYYMVKNYEFITVSGADTLGLDATYLNIGEETDLTITHLKKKTELSYTLSDESIVSFDLSTGKVIALSAGETKLSIISENEEYGPFDFTFKVGDGSENNPFYIKNEEDLKAVGGTRIYGEKTYDWKADKHYSIICDIFLNSNWTPLCQDENNPFTGTLSGYNGSHKIHNMVVTESSTTADAREYAGLFTYIEGAEVSNIIFVEPKIVGRFDFAGVVAGINSGSKVKNVEVKNGEIRVAPYTEGTAICFAGGIVGSVEGLTMGTMVENDKTITLANEAKITMCTFTGKIGTLESAMTILENSTKTYYEIGGITGYVMGATIYNNKATVDFEIDSTIALESKNSADVSIHIGGIAGAIATAGELITEDSKKGIIYPIVKNNLAIVSIDNETNATNGVIGNIPVDVQTFIAGKAECTVSEDGLKVTYVFNGKSKTANVSSNKFTINGVEYTIVSSEKITYNDGEIKEITVNSRKFEIQYAEIAEQRVIGNYFYSKDSSITNGGSILTYATTRIVSEYELGKQETYVSYLDEKWDIGTELSVWAILNGEPIINEIGMENTTAFKQDIYEISSASDFAKYYERMTVTVDTTKSQSEQTVQKLIKKYWLSQSYVLKSDINIADTGITNYIPIGSKEFAFSGIFDGNGKTITFTSENGFISEKAEGIKYAGFFGQIAKTAQVKNLTISGFSVDYAEYAGILAGANYGEISNCRVKDFAIQNAIYAGGIVGVNYGTISNSLEEANISTSDASVNNTINLSSTDKSVFAGAVTAINHGTIKGIKTENYVIISGTNTTSSDASKAFGGVVGYNTGLITDCTISQIKIKDSSTCRAYFGGIAGINAGKISLCTVGNKKEGTLEAIIVANHNTEGKQIAGGFAGMITPTGTVEKSIANISIDCYKAGGFAAYLLGSVTESYNTGAIRGNEVGGFAVHFVLTGTKDNVDAEVKVKNCYTKIKLTALNDNSKLAGIAVYVRYPAVVENCYVACTFSGGQAYFESYTNTRESYINWVNSWANKTNRLGTITNVIINTNPDVSTSESGEDVKSGSSANQTKALISYNNQIVKYLTNDECTSSLIENTLESLNFSMEDIWQISTENDKVFVGLKAVEGLHNFTQVIIEEIE